MAPDSRIVSTHTIESNHEELIHDAQANFYGTRLATCSSDTKIKIFELNGGNQSKLIEELNGHEQAVWQLDWSHPEFGNWLASCSMDRKVIIWREEDGKMKNTFVYNGHDSSVNCVSWAPREYGLILGCASADGAISILRYRHDDNHWDTRKIADAHKVGVNCLSWAPPISSVSTIYAKPQVRSLNAGNLTGDPSASSSYNNNNPANLTSSNMMTATGDTTAALQKPALVLRFVSGGCDNLVKIWRFDDYSDEWIEERSLDSDISHTDWVRDVAWAPSIGLPKWYIASCSQDKRVIIWTNAEGPNGSEWESEVLHVFDDIVWHVSWSMMGNILAVSWGENHVSLWKEDLNGHFKCISDTTT